MATSIEYEGATFKTLKADEVKFESQYKIGNLNDISYQELRDVFGPPTIDQASGDNKVQYEWIIKVVDADNKEYQLAIYDWKTYDREYTENHLRTWSIGGNDEGNPYLLKSFVMLHQMVGIVNNPF